MAYSADSAGDIWQTMIYVPEERAWSWAPSLELVAVISLVLIPNTFGIAVRLSRCDLYPLLLLLITFVATLANLVATHQVFSGVQGGTVFDGRLTFPTMALFSMALDGARLSIQFLESETYRRLDNAKSVVASSSAVFLTLATFGMPGPSTYEDNLMGFWATATSFAVFLAAYVKSLFGSIPDENGEASSFRHFADYACAILVQVIEAYTLWHLSEDAISVLVLILISALLMYSPMAAGNFKVHGLPEYLICLGNTCLKCYLYCKHIHLPDELVY